MLLWNPEIKNQSIKKTNRMLMVRGSRVKISCGFKVEFCVEKLFHGVFASSDYSADKFTVRITDEMDMTPLQVSC